MPAQQHRRTPVEEAALAPRPALRADQARKLGKWLEADLNEQSSVAELLKAGVRAEHLRALQVPVPALLRAGASLNDIKAFGFDALDLAHSPSLAGQLVSHFGKAQTAAAFLDSPSSAVALAASDAMRILGLTPRLLVKATAGAPEECLACLEQLCMKHSVEVRAAGAGGGPMVLAHPLQGIGIDELASAGLDVNVIEARLGVPVPALGELLGVDLARNPMGLSTLGHV